MLKGINFNFGLNIYGTIVFSDREWVSTDYKGANIVAISLVRMRRNSVNTASGLKSAVTVVFIGHDIL